MSDPQTDLEEIFSAEGPLAGVVEGFAVRPDQGRYSSAVLEAITNCTTLMAEAGTGTGKTLAYLAAAVLSGKKVVISTATKTLQTQILERDVPLLSRALDLPISAELLKGRNNYLCLRRYHKRERQRQLVSSTGEKILQRWLAHTTTGDRGEISELPENFDLWSKVCATSETCWGQKCPKQDECYLQARRRAAQRAQLVVVNHHLFFADLAVRTGGGEVLPRYSVVIFDEAHHLESVATRYFGVRASSYRVSELVRDAVGLDGGKALPDSFVERVEAIQSAADAFWASLPVPEGSKRITEAIDGEPGRRLENLLGSLELWLERISERAAHSTDAEGLERRSRALLGELRLFAQPLPPGEVRWAERRGRGVYLHSVPVDVGPTLKELLFTGRVPIVLTSATLRVGGSFDYIRRRLGLPEHAAELVAPGPFDYANNCLIHVPKEMPDPNNSTFSTAAAEMIERILKASDGRAFCLFTSHRVLRAVAGLLEGRLPYNLLVQGQAPRDTLLRKFREDVHSVLLGAQAFWEGVDVPGQALSAVVIDKLPFESPGDPLVEARVEKIRTGGGSPFSEYQLPVAAMALRQGVGRLIRRVEDRGVIVILDRRLMTRGYGGFLRKSLPPAPISSDFSDVEKFFSADPLP